MAGLDPQFIDAIRDLSATLGEDVGWALTGSTSFALQGVPIEPNDVDLQTSEEGAYEIANLFPEAVVEAVSFEEAELIRSHFGVLELHGVRVEVMGDVQKRGEDGTWEPPVDVEDHRAVVDVDGRGVPVLSLSYEARAYERLGRTERAALLREYADSGST